MYQERDETLRFLNWELDNVLLEIDRSKGEQDDFALRTPCERGTSAQRREEIQ